MQVLQRHALFASERGKVCEHQWTHYRGQIPCTGPVLCEMCGGLWDNRTPAEVRLAGSACVPDNYSELING